MLLFDFAKLPYWISLVLRKKNPKAQSNPVSSIYFLTQSSPDNPWHIALTWSEQVKRLPASGEVKPLPLLFNTVINCFSIRSSQPASTRQKYYLHSSSENFKLKSLTTLHDLSRKENNVWLKVGHRKVTVKLKYKWAISDDYPHPAMLCGVYFTLPKVLIKALYCQHLVNIKIIIYAIITFQTLLTCSDLHGAWFSNYTKTLKRRKMVSRSCTTAAGARSAQAWVPRPVLVLSPGGRSRHGLSSWSRLHFGCFVLPGAWKRGDCTSERR